MNYIQIAILLLLSLSGAAHIYSSTPRVTYDFDGKPKTYHIFLSLEMGLGDDDYLKIIWPETIHTGTDKTLVKANLISYSNNLQIVSTNFIAQVVDSNPIYYVTFGHALTANKWYEIQITPNKDATISKGLIQV